MCSLNGKLEALSDSYRRVLQGAELNYLGLEKLILALVHATRRLQRRIAKWAIKLREHDIEFKGRDSVKGQIPAYFLGKTPLKEDNKREISTGLMLVNPEGKEYTYALRYEFKAMNNEVEYKALLTGLRIVEETEIKNLAIFVDSQLIVNQVKGLFESRQPAIEQYLEKTKEILKSFDTYSMDHIQRNQNKKADALSKLASMTFEHLTKEVLVEVFVNRSINNKEVSTIAVETKESWMIFDCATDCTTQNQKR
ncbi:reverse transcriptase domain-containing protein [Tanacetum coccineum]